MRIRPLLVGLVGALLPSLAVADSASAPLNFQGTLVGDSWILSWGTPTYTGAIVEYRVFGGMDPSRLPLLASTDETSTTVPNLGPGSYFAVAAYLSDGTIGAVSWFQVLGPGGSCVTISLDGGVAIDLDSCLPPYGN